MRQKLYCPWAKQLIEQEHCCVVLLEPRSWLRPRKCATYYSISTASIRVCWKLVVCFNVMAGVQTRCIVRVVPISNCCLIAKHSLGLLADFQGFSEHSHDIFVCHASVSRAAEKKGGSEVSGTTGVALFDIEMRTPSIRKNTRMDVHQVPEGEYGGACRRWITRRHGDSDSANISLFESIRLSWRLFMTRIDSSKLCFIARPHCNNSWLPAVGPGFRRNHVL
jgi:hypothetical protein